VLSASTKLDLTANDWRRREAKRTEKNFFMISGFKSYGKVRLF
jgi:hypothetical protein